MTREEAIEVLENGEWWEELSEWYMVVHPEHDKLHDAVDMAVSAIRQQETVENPNEPLTLDELRQMDGEPVWLVNQNGGRWVIMSGVYLWDSRKNADYGKTWLAYRQQPVEDDHVV